MAPWRLRLLARRSVQGFAESGGTRLAAAIAYYALLSLFPLVIVLVSGAALVLPAEGAREEVIDAVVDALPLTSEGAGDVRAAMRGASASAGPVGALGLVGLLWTASGMMGAIRAGLTEVTGAERPRPFLRGKLVDIAMVLACGLVLLASTVATVTMRVAEDHVLEPIGLAGAAGAIAGAAVPIVLAFGVLVALMRLVPARPVPWAGAWRGAVAGAVALWTLATGFGFYVESFGRYNAIYGSLGAAAALLAFLYLAAIVLLMAAAVADRWAGVANAPQPSPGAPGASSAGERVRSALASLVRWR